jgi:hypothetical protein
MWHVARSPLTIERIKDMGNSKAECGPSTLHVTKGRTLIRFP